MVVDVGAWGMGWLGSDEVRVSMIVSARRFGSDTYRIKVVRSTLMLPKFVAPTGTTPKMP